MKKIFDPFVVLSVLFIASFSTAMALETADTRERLIKDFERAKSYSTEYMQAMPEDGFGFKPTPEVRSFAQQFLHIAGANYFFTSSITGKDNPKAGVDFEKLNEYQSKDACIKAVEDSYDFVITSIRNMSESELGETIKFFNQFDITRGVAFDKAFEHGTHHRGQTTIYLRLKGVAPPAEKLF